MPDPIPLIGKPPVRRTRTAKLRGASTQAMVARWYQRLWPAAQPIGSGESGRDVLNVPVNIEVKGRKDFDPIAAIKQMVKRGREPGDVLPGFAVIRPFKMGEAHLADWLVVRRLADDTDILEELLWLRNTMAVLFRGNRRELLEYTEKNGGLMSESARAELEALRAQEN